MNTKDRLIGPIELEASLSYRDAVAFRMVDGVDPLDKFGVNPVITTNTDPEDLWEYGGEYIYDADGTAPIINMTSTSASDSGLPIQVEGLDVDGYFVSQEVICGGTSPVALGTPLWRVFRMENNGSVDIQGLMYVHTTATAGPTTVRAMIAGEHNQTLMCMLTIPKGKVGFLVRGELGVELEGNSASLAEYAHLHYESRRYGKVFKVKKALTCLVGGNAVYQDERSFPDIVPSLTDIKINIVEVTQTMGVWGTLDLMMVDEEKLPKKLLIAIGQEGY